MINKTKYSGIALLEALLAIFIITIASIGVLYLYQRYQITSKMDGVRNQIIALQSTFSNLQQSRLTQGLSTSSDLVNLFYNSNKLPANYFKVDATANKVHLFNANGEVIFSQMSSNQFSATIPLNTTNPVYQQSSYCDALKDYLKSCTTGAGDDENSILITVYVGD